MQNQQRVSPKETKPKRSVIRKKACIKLEHIDISSKSVKNASKEIKQQTVICIDDDTDEQEPMQLEKKTKRNEEVEKQIQPLRQELEYRVENYLSKLPENDFLKVIKLNHFFKWKGIIYFEVMLGRSRSQIYREPQLMTLQQLSTNSETKQMVYHYIATICKSSTIPRQEKSRVDQQ